MRTAQKVYTIRINVTAEDDVPAEMFPKEEQLDGAVKGASLTFAQEVERQLTVDYGSDASVTLEVGAVTYESSDSVEEKL